MKPAPVEYERARSVEHALECISNDPDAKVLAGGQSLVTLMNLRLARPTRLVDIGGLGELDRVFADPNTVVIGALACHRRLELDRDVSQGVPLLSEAARHIGHVAIRNRGTLGGSLAHADPAAELPAVMVALGATIYVESRARGRREIPATEFFLSHYTTALADDEIVTWIRVPTLKQADGWGFVEFARRSGDFALSGAACVVRFGLDGAISRLRAVLIAASDVPLVVSDDSAVGRQPTHELVVALARAWTPTSPSLDEYQRRLGHVALSRALSAAFDPTGRPRSPR